MENEFTSPLTVHTSIGAYVTGFKILDADRKVYGYYYKKEEADRAISLVNSPLSDSGEE